MGEWRALARPQSVGKGEPKETCIPMGVLCVALREAAYCGGSSVL